ncbi:MAG: response regulator [Bacteroidales bacterium]|nr:response regulator [Bacteroidales bacterium]
MTRLMLIEDDQTMKSLLTTLLGLEGFELANCDDKSLDSIINSISVELPGIILMDVHIRNIDGVEILKLIKKEPDFSNIRILMTSGMDLKEKCLKSGADGFLMKPYMPDELISWLREHTS